MKRLVTLLVCVLMFTASLAATAGECSNGYYPPSYYVNILSSPEAAADFVGSYYLGTARMLALILLMQNLHGAMRRGPTGGDLFTAMEVGVDGSWADVDYEDLDSDGDDLYGSAYWAGMVADTWQFGLAVNYDDLETSGNYDIDQETTGANVWANYLATNQLSFGIFLDASKSDFKVQPGPGQPGVPIDEDDSRYGAGILTSYVWAGPWDIDMAATATAASMNKESIDETLNAADSYLMLMLDGRRQLTDMLSADLYAAYTTEFDKKDASSRPRPDTSFWTVGGALELAVDEQLAVSLGYEQPLAISDYEERRVTAAVTYRF